MVEQTVRGSSHLDALSVDDLHRAIGTARESYKIERWWKYGQPRIDLIEATLNVSNPAQVGSVVGGLVNRQGSEVQVSFEVFPYGITAPEGARINVKLNQMVH